METCPQPPEVDYQVHLLLCIASLWCAATVLIEATHRTSPMAALLRPLATCVQGSFMLHAAFMLFKNHATWDQPNAPQMVPWVFTNHLLAWSASAFFFLLYLEGGEQLGSPRAHISLRGDDELTKAVTVVDMGGKASTD